LRESLDDLERRRGHESSELAARLESLRQQSDPSAREILELRAEALEQSLQQADLREAHVHDQLSAIEADYPNQHALATLAKLEAELAEKNFLRAQERISARALEAAIRIEAQIAAEAAPADESPWDQALRELRSNKLRLQASSLRLHAEEAGLESQRTEMRHLRDQVEDRLYQLEQMFLPGGPGLPADLALEELRRLERNADPQAFRGEIQALIAHSQAANERYAAWKLSRDPSAHEQSIELDGFRSAFLAQGGDEVAWQEFLRAYVQADAELANTRALYGEALRLRAAHSQQRTELRLEVRELRLARRSLLRRENLLLRMPFRIRPAEMASEASRLRHFPGAFGVGISGLREWFAQIDHIAAFLGWLLLAGGLLAAARRAEQRLDRWLDARRDLPAAESDPEVLRLAWTRRAGILALAPLFHAFALAVALELGARFLEGAHPGVETLLGGLTWMIPSLFLAWRLSQLWFDADPIGGEPWGMTDRAARRTRNLLRVSLWMSTAILPVRLVLTSASAHASAWQDALTTLLTLGVGLGAYALLRFGGPLSRMAPRTGRAAWFGRLFQLLRRILSVLVFGIVALDFLAFDFLVEQIVSSSLDLLVVAALVFVFHQAFHALLDRRMAQFEARNPRTGTAQDLPNRIATGPAFVLGAPLMTLAVLNWTGWLDRWDLARLFDRPIPFIGLEADNPITWWMFGQALVVLAAAVFMGRLAEFWLATLGQGKSRHDQGLRYTASKLVSYCIIGIGAYLALTHLFDTSSLGYAVAALSLGIGFGLQEIVSNFVSGLILLFERPLQVGDLVQVGETVGVVERINIRATTVRTLDNEFILVPNRELVTKDVVNHTHNDPRLRVRVPVGVAYGSDLAVVREALLSAAKDNRLILKRPAPEAFFKGFGDSSLDFELRAWISRPLDRPAVTSELNNKIDAAFRAAGVTIPFPQRDLHLRSVDTEAGQHLRGTDPASGKTNEGPSETGPA
jgi:small-conductance mechanosensitive channel